MNRWETLTALAAVIAASVAALPVPGRLWYVLAAVAMLAAVGGLRMRASLRSRQTPTGLDANERARAIRAARHERRER